MDTSKWLKHTFENSSVTTDDFKAFSREFKKHIKKIFGAGYEVNLTSNHYYIYGFISKNDKHVYLSFSDVRHFPNEWYNNILIRTAKNNSDFSGGVNKYSTLDKIKDSVDRLLEK